MSLVYEHESYIRVMSHDVMSHVSICHDSLVYEHESYIRVMSLGYRRWWGCLFSRAVSVDYMSTAICHDVMSHVTICQQRCQVRLLIFSSGIRHYHSTTLLLYCFTTLLMFCIYPSTTTFVSCVCVYLSVYLSIYLSIYLYALYVFLSISRMYLSM